MLEVALCDDEKSELDRIETIVLQYCFERKLKFNIDKYLSGLDLLKCYKQYTIIFLDIQMKSLNGIELAKKIRQRDKHVKIIYLTNFSNYQTDAFTVRAFGYVVKPYTKEIIFKQLDDAIEYSMQEGIRVTFTFNTDQGIKTINIKDIYYFEAWCHKIRIICNNDTFEINDNLMHILNNSKSYGFSMPHKSFVINMHYISSIKGYEVMLTNGTSIPISQKRAVEFKKEFHLFLKSNFNLLMMR